MNTPSAEQKQENRNSVSLFHFLSYHTSINNLSPKILANYEEKQANKFETTRKPAILFSTNHCLLQIFRTFAQDINTITIMTAMQLRLNSELFGALQVISEDEGLMEKAVKALKRIASQKQTTDETEYIMSSPAMVEILKQGQEDIKNGKGTTIELEDLWK